MISLFPNFTACIQSYMNFAGAEASPELQEQLLAYNPDKVVNLHYMDLSVYLSFVQRLVRFFKVHFSKILKNI